jgi:glycosyltransferase involved in cell wall biosynthesis
MNKFHVTTARWANWRDVKMPFYEYWNRENKLPPGFWQRIWEYPFVSSQIPAQSRCLDVGGTYPFVLFKNFPNAQSIDNRDLNKLDHPLHKDLWPAGSLKVADATQLPYVDNEFEYSFCISALEEMPDPEKVIREMIRVTRRRIVITTDISEKLGLSAQMLFNLSRIFGFTLPVIPSDALVSNDEHLKDWGITQLNEYRSIRTLGLVIESLEDPASCGILVPHWESYPFMEACVRNIGKQVNEHVRTHIYILDDDSEDGSFEKMGADFSDVSDITLLQIKRPDKAFQANVGLLLDEGLKHVNEKYVCMLDADAFPISPYWLSFPIYLLEKYNCSSVGCDTGLSNAYLAQSLYHWQNKDGYTADFALYDNENFTCTNNFYRLMRTATAKVVSEQVGFARTVSMPIRRCRMEQRLYKLAEIIHSKLTTDKSAYNFLIKSDNGVAANYFIDINKLGPKFSLPIISWVALSPQDGAFGQNICGLLFHFALSTRALSSVRREISNIGETYMEYALRIKTEGFSDALLEESLGQCQIRAGGYHGEFPIDWYFAAQKAFQAEFDNYLSSGNNS